MINLRKVAEEKGIKYFLISFVDLFGVLRAKMVPAEAIEGMQKDGAGFAGFASWLDMTPAHPDMFGVPDPDSLIQLPWKPEIGWLCSDLWMDGKEVEASPRVALKRQIAKLNKMGYRPKAGVECEFFLINPEGNALSDLDDKQKKPCYDQQALMRRYEVIRDICDSMLELGWKPYQNDHEDGNGQFEMNWDYDDVLKTADRHTFFKYMTRSIAENYGIRATFMPKPFAHLTGNGCHSHISLWDHPTGKKNIFNSDRDSRNLGLSEIAYNFLGGIMENAQALCAIFNPSVNSYKRIGAGSATSSGASWSPSTVTYSGNNRTHLVRVPDNGRFELRLMDGATNPYLSQAGILAAGAYGITNKCDPGEPININMYEDAYDAKPHEILPKNLLDALRLLDKSKILREAMGDDLISAIIKLRTKEWDDYSSKISQWELDNTIDC
jgi:glutamine synthetase